MTHTLRSSAWRWMPAAIAGWLALTAAVNSAMVYYALHSFPGEAGANAFDISNHYDVVLQASRQEARLGWLVGASTDRGWAVVKLTDAQGGSLPGVSITGVALRPVGPAHATPLVFHAGPSPVFRASAPLPGRGQWDLALTISAAGRTMHVTRRVIVQ